MGSPGSRIEANLRRIRDNIAAARARSPRSMGDVAVVAVTKSADLGAIKALVELGLTDLAESRVQQLCERAAEIEAFVARRRAETPPVRWHMVGHLQRNKVRQVMDVPQLAMIHSVDSLRLAEEINRRAELRGRVVEVLMEVNCSEEPQKFGCKVGAATHLAELVCTLSHLSLVGLMTMAPQVSDAEESRPTFVRLRELFEEMRRDRIGGPNLKHLSMGMSQDYPVAVEEGATILRIGTALFA